MERYQTRYEEFNGLRCKSGYRLVNSTTQDNMLECIRKAMFFIYFRIIFLKLKTYFFPQTSRGRALDFDICVEF